MAFHTSLDQQDLADVSTICPKQHSTTMPAIQIVIRSSAIVTSPSGAVAKYCDEYVCVCVRLSVRGDISGTTRAIFTNFLCMWYGQDSVLLRRRCDCYMLFTSGFVDDVMFFL